MGHACSHQFCCSSLFRHKSKPTVRGDDGRVSDEDETGFPVANSDPSLIDDPDVPVNNLHPVGELVPERYLVLLTEQMTEMLFRLMTCNETSVITPEGGSDHRTSLDNTIDSSHGPTPSSNSPGGQSLVPFESVHQSCLKCNTKMLTIEEFHELHKAFRRVDNDRDNFLTRDEIRTTLNYLFELTEYDIKEIISVFDVNKDDQISLEEYIEEMKHRLLHEFTREELKLAFDQADMYRNGHLHMDELKNAIGYLNMHLPNRRIVEIINNCMNDEATDSIDFLLFTSIVESLHRREPITLQKFKPIHHHTYSPVTA